MNKPTTAQSQFDAIQEIYSHLSIEKIEYYCIANFTICIAHLQETFPIPLTESFQHLRAYNHSSTVDLTIYLCNASKIRKPLPNLNWNAIRSQSYKENIFFHFFEYIEALSVLNIQTKTAYYIVRNANALPWWVLGSPLQIIIHWWMREKGLQLTHTAAVSNTGKAILLTGKGGSGKSTTVLSCLKQGMSVLGEDYCLISAQNNIPIIHSVYQSAKLCFSNLLSFPEYKDFIKNPESAIKEKALLYYQDIFPNQLEKTAKISAIFSLEVSNNEEPSIKMISKQQCFKSLGLSTIAQLPNYKITTHTILQSIVEILPCYELMLGKNLIRNVDFIKNYLTS